MKKIMMEIWTVTRLMVVKLLLVSATAAVLVAQWLTNLAKVLISAAKWFTKATMVVTK